MHSLPNAMIAVALFLVILASIGIFYVRMGRLTFWKLAAASPEQAYQHVSSDKAWVILNPSQPAPDGGYSGPFFLGVPSQGSMLKLYARSDQIEASQQQFINQYRDLLPRRGVPIYSILAMVYPVAAMLHDSGYQGVPTLFILGGGFANLGYLLAGASLYPGHFYALGLDSRPITLIAGVGSFVVGFILTNGSI